MPGNFYELPGIYSHAGQKWIHADKKGHHADKKRQYAAKTRWNSYNNGFLLTLLWLSSLKPANVANTLAGKDQTVAMIVTVAVMIPADDGLTLKVEKLGYLFGDMPGKGGNA